MQLTQTKIKLKDAERYLSLKGHYRLVDIKMYEHYLADFQFVVTISDGETELKLNTFKSVRLPIGGFVYVEASFKKHVPIAYWDLHGIRLSRIEEALNCFDIEVDLAHQKGTRCMPLSIQMEQVKTASLVQLKQMFIQGYWKERTIDQCYSFYDSAILRETLSWLFSIEFDDEKQRDYAVIGALLWMGFKHYIDPNYKLSSLVHDLQGFRDFVEKGIATISKLDVDLANHFKRLMNEKLMLNIDGSQLSDTTTIKVLQVVFFHAATVPDFFEEKRYA